MPENPKKMDVNHMKDTLEYSIEKLPLLSDFVKYKQEENDVWCVKNTA